eukprot:gene29324-38404_t
MYRSIIRFQAIGSAFLETSIIEEERTHFHNDDVNGDTKNQIFHNIGSNSNKFDKFLNLVEELLDIDSIKSRSSVTSTKDTQLESSNIWKDNWIRVRPKFSPSLNNLHESLVDTQRQMQTELTQLNQSLGAKSKANKPLVMLESSDVHGPHFRVTKKEAPGILKKMQQLPQPQKAEVLSNQKSGCLFVTPRLKILCQRFRRVRGEYEEMQRDIVLQAVTLACELVAELDCLSTLAYVAVMSDWVAPKMTEQGSKDLVVTQLRHPCLDARLGHGRYIPSDVTVSAKTATCILTGPNMGGKSTFMRALGICVVLAHMGSFVPAKEAQIPIYDQVLIRVGATDCAEKGQSTFLAEMDSVSTILRSVTADSLVLVDELGRGTSTQDGFGIAWAVIHELTHSVRCTLFFATHFHELTAMESSAVTLPRDEEDGEEEEAVGAEREGKGQDRVQTGVQNLHVSAHVKEDPSCGNTTVSMLYAVCSGACERSYGIHVARAARFPQAIIDDASVLERQMLRALDQGGQQPIAIARDGVGRKRTHHMVAEEEIGIQSSLEGPRVGGYVAQLQQVLALVAAAESSTVQQQMRLAKEYFEHNVDR